MYNNNYNNIDSKLDSKLDLIISEIIYQLIETIECNNSVVEECNSNELIIMSWNINGIKNLLSDFDTLNELQSLGLDILLLQDIRSGNLNYLYQLSKICSLPYVYYNLSEKVNYAGVAILSSIKPDEVFVCNDILPEEGRIIFVRFNETFIVNLYTPYIGQDQVNITKRLMWENDIIILINSLKPSSIIIGGNLNVAPEEIDRYRVSKYHPGCSIEESNMFNNLLKIIELQDCYRTLCPNRKGYTWREGQSKLRVDYFLASNKVKYTNCFPLYSIHKTNSISKHYPLILTINM